MVFSLSEKTGAVVSQVDVLATAQVVTSFAETACGWTVFSPSAGAHTYVLGVILNNKATILVPAIDPLRISVEDIGASL